MRLYDTNRCLVDFAGFIELRRMVKLAINLHLHKFALYELAERANGRSIAYDSKHFFIMDFLSQVRNLFCVVLREKSVKIVCRRFYQFCPVDLSIPNIGKNLCQFPVIARVE
jgi:hypothetical protein